MTQPHKIKDEINIEISIECELLPIDEDRIRKVIHAILTDEGYEKGGMEISIIDDETIHRLNVQFLNHDWPTDVLAFEMDNDPDQKLLEGNVIVSAETAAERSKEFGMTPEDELFLYIVHGTLHLVGYDDHTPEDEPAMREKERQYLALGGVMTTGR